MHKKIFLWAAAFCFLAVVVGALGSHWLKPKITEDHYKSFQTALQYNFYHGFALFIVGLLYRNYKDFKLTAAAIFFGIGIFLFSFSIYVFAVTTTLEGGAMYALLKFAPFGGVFFILGWLFVFLYFWKNSESGSFRRTSDKSNKDIE